VRIELLELHPGVLLPDRRAVGLHAHIDDRRQARQEALEARDQAPHLQTPRPRALGAGAGNLRNRFYVGEPTGKLHADHFQAGTETGEVQTRRRAAAAAGRTNSHLNAGRRILRHPAERGG
jgi:hypothetical protein